jgi:hypothetical protein
MFLLNETRMKCGIPRKYLPKILNTYDTSIQNSSILMNYYLLVATVSCLIFYYHMNGADIGKLGVYVHERDASLGTAALEITGDQGNQWNQGKVQLDFSTFYDDNGHNYNG